MDREEFDPVELANFQEKKLQEIENTLQFEFQQAKGVFINKLQKIGNVQGTGNRFLTNYRLYKAEKLAESLGKLLKISPEIISEAKRMYQFVQSKNWVQGRSTTLVILACLYYFCRKYETGHLMIDFADEMKINVFSLSKMYLKLTRDMNLSVRLTDPSMYVPRFLRALNFDKSSEKCILDYVLRLLARMRKDWLGQGRRPSGLIAASFWIASKCFGIRKSIKEISSVLKVSEETIRKRVNEFKNLKVACLTREEFQNLEHLNYSINPADPPSFTKARAMSIIENDPKNLLTFPSFAIEQTKKTSEITNNGCINPNFHPLMNRENQESFFRASLIEENFLLNSEKNIISRRSSAIMTPVQIEKIVLNPCEINVKNTSEILLTIENKNGEMESKMEIDKFNNQFDIKNENMSEFVNNAVVSVEQDDSIIRPEEFNDEEVDKLILQPYEIKFKTLAWNKMNKSWIEEQKVKQTKISDSKVNFKKIRKIQREKEKPLFRESSNEIVNSIKNSRIGRKINTEALESLFERAKNYEENVRK